VRLQEHADEQILDRPRIVRNLVMTRRFRSAQLVRFDVDFPAIGSQSCRRAASLHQESYFHALVCDLFGENHSWGRQQYEIQKLNDARSDSEGNVELANGQFLHQIELIPAPAHYDFP
jgi:hypothetical protein